MPGLRFVESFHSDPAYIKALAQNVNDYWVQAWRADHLVLSFHGLPSRNARPWRPLPTACAKATARLLAHELGLEAKQWTLAFQSRFGQRGMAEAVYVRRHEAAGQNEVRRVDVFGPGFVADCLETLEEIAIEAQVTFLKSGGKEFHADPLSQRAPALGSWRWRTSYSGTSRAGSRSRRTSMSVG